MAAPRTPARLAALLAAGAAALAVAAAAQTGAPAAAAPGFQAAGRWIVYPDGRVFLPHGFNLVVTRPPYWHARFGDADARFLAANGFTALRMNFLPQALEPQPGSFDVGYLQHFADRAADVSRYGIAVLPTLNQDGYDERCGIDGFPEWMVLAPCESVWQPFWANAPAEDGTGLQDHFLAMWRLALPRFPSANVLGFDLMNEPVAPDEPTLAAFWQRTVEELAPDAGGRLLFVEPGAAGGTSSGTTVRRGTGYTTHVYCQATLRKAFTGRAPSAAEVAGCIRHDATLLRQDVAFAARHGYPLVVGEFGASDELREQAALVDAMGEAFVPWTVYAYNARLDASGTRSQSILVNEGKPGSDANAKQAKLDALVVPHPLAVAGTPASWRFDRRSRAVRFRYSTRPVRPLHGRPPTVVFVPRRVYPQGYRVAVTGARVVSPARSPWLRLVARPGAAAVTVRIEPRTGSSTLTPLQAGRCGYDLRPCALR